MEKQKKKQGRSTPQNLVLEACAKTIETNHKLDNQMYKHYQMAQKFREKAETLAAKRRVHHITMCKEITDEILARDFQLDDVEEKFLTMPLYCGKNHKEKHIRLLEDLVRRHFHTFYPPIDKDKTILLSQFYKIIPIETNIGLFFRNLNRKFDGVLKFNVGNFNFKRLESYEDKINISIQFLPEERP